MSAKIGGRRFRRGMDRRAQIDFLDSLRLTLKVLKAAEPQSPVEELRRMIQSRIAELKIEASHERKHTALAIPCPVCNQRAGLPCVSLPSKTQFGKKNDPSFASHEGGQLVIMRWPHRQRILAHRSATEGTERGDDGDSSDCRS